MRRFVVMTCVVLAVGTVCVFAARRCLESGSQAGRALSPAPVGAQVAVNGRVRPVSVGGITMPVDAPTDVELAIRLLQSPDPEERGQAASWIGFYGAEAKPAVPYLIKLLADKSQRFYPSIFTPYGPTPPDLEAMRALSQLRDVALPELLQALKSRNKTVPHTVVQSLGNMFPLKEAGREKVSVRFAVANILGEMRCKEAVPGLLRLLENSDPSLRMPVALSLIRIGTPEAIDGAISVINDPRILRRDDIVRELGRARAKRAIPAITGLFGDSEQVASSAVYALGEIGGKSVIEPLRKAAENPNRFIKGYALDTLVELGDPYPFQVLVRELGKEESDIEPRTIAKIAQANNPAVIYAALNALNSGRNVELAVAALDKSKDPRIVPALAGALGTADRPDFVRAAGALNARNKDALKNAVARLMSRQDDWKRELVDSFLKAPKPKTTVREFLSSLGDTSDHERGDALEKLAELGVQDQAPDQIIAVLDDSEPRNRWMAAGLLEQIGDAKSVAALTKALKDSNPGVRARAVESLGDIGTPAAVEALIGELMDPNSSIRPNAVWALGFTKTPKAMKYIKAAMYDNSEAVRRRAGYILDPPPNAHPRIKKREFWREFGGSAMARFYIGHGMRTAPDKRSTQELIAALTDPNEEQRDAAINTLRGRKDKASVEPLIGLLQSDPSPKVRANAAYALMLTKDPRAIPPMLRILTTEPPPPANPQPTIRANRATLDAVIDLLNYPDEGVVRVTQEALRRMTGQDFGDNRREWSRWVAANVRS